MAARGYGMDHFVRLPATDYASVMRPLEAGAGGLMISMVRSPAEVEQAVRWAKFWPRGERGLNGGNCDGRFGLTPLAEYTARANAETFLGIQIETAGALESVAEIAAIPDVDLLFVGPSDLSQVLGVTGEFENPKCLKAIESIAQACAACRQALGNLQPRARICRPHAKLGLPALRPRRRHPRDARRHSQRQGTLLGVLSVRRLDRRGGLAPASHGAAITASGQRRTEGTNSLLRFCSIADRTPVVTRR